MNVKGHDKRGKVICEIEEPAVAERKVKYPSNIEEWAWNTAQAIAIQQESRNRAMAEVMIDKTNNPSWLERLKRLVTGRQSGIDFVGVFEDYICPTCGNNTIEPVARFGLTLVIGFRPGTPVTGYACMNPSCPVQDVIIPRILVERIDDKTRQWDKH